MVGKVLTGRPVFLSVRVSGRGLPGSTAARCMTYEGKGVRDERRDEGGRRRGRKVYLRVREEDLDWKRYSQALGQNEGDSWREDERDDWGYQDLMRSGRRHER